MLAGASTNPPVTQAVNKNPGAQVITPGPQVVKAKSFAKVFNVKARNPGAQVITPGAQVVKAKSFAKAAKANPIVQQIAHRPPVTTDQTRVGPPFLSPNRGMSSIYATTLSPYSFGFTKIISFYSETA